MPDPMARVSNELAGTLFAPREEPARIEPTVKQRHPMSERSLEANRRRSGSTRAAHLSVLNLLYRVEEETFDGICKALDWPSSRSGRMTELCDLGFIARTGAKAETRWGSQADLWKITAMGIAELRRRREKR